MTAQSGCEGYMQSQVSVQVRFPFILGIFKWGEELHLCERWAGDLIPISVESYTWHILLLLSMLPSALCWTVALVASTSSCISQVKNAMWECWPWHLSLDRRWKVAFKGVGSLTYQARGECPLTANALNVGKGAGQISPDVLWSPFLGLEALARQRRPPYIGRFILSLVEGATS